MQCDPIKPFLNCSQNLEFRMEYPHAIPCLGYNIVFIELMKVIALYLS